MGSSSPSSLLQKHLLILSKYRCPIYFFKKPVLSQHTLIEYRISFFPPHLFYCLPIWLIKLLISTLAKVIFRKISLPVLHPRDINNNNKKKAFHTVISRERNQSPFCLIHFDTQKQALPYHLTSLISQSIFLPNSV